MPDGEVPNARATRTGARAVTISMRRLSKRELERGRLEYPETYAKPQTRTECVDGPRPCPYVSCRHHLYLDVTDVGAIRVNKPDDEVWEMRESCSLDVAERGPLILDQVGEVMNLTRERIRQLEYKAKANAAPGLRSLLTQPDDNDGPGPSTVPDCRPRFLRGDEIS